MNAFPLPFFISFKNCLRLSPIATWFVFDYTTCHYLFVIKNNELSFVSPCFTVEIDVINFIIYFMYRTKWIWCVDICHIRCVWNGEEGVYIQTLVIEFCQQIQDIIQNHKRIIFLTKVKAHKKENVTRDKMKWSIIIFILFLIFDVTPNTKIKSSISCMEEILFCFLYIDWIEHWLWKYLLNINFYEVWCCFSVFRWKFVRSVVVR